MEKKALGKGLDALIPKKLSGSLAEKEFTYLPIDKINAGKYQPRKTIDNQELKELSQSIKEKGFIQPVVVRKCGHDNYEIVAGGRRYQAAKLLGLNQIPAIVKELDDKDALTFAIVENLQRKDLDPIEEAQAFSRLVVEFEFSLDSIAQFVGKDKTTVSNILRLLKLPKDIQEALSKGLINRSQARTILAAASEEEQKKIFHDILKGGLSVREIEKRVKKGPLRKKTSDPFVLEVEDTLQKLLGTKVSIANKRNNRGKIIIEYFSLNDLERIIERIKK